jgi:hypothetical protein
VKNLRTVDFLVFALIFLVGNILYFDPQNWSHAYVGSMQYGDAEFWWSGATQLSQGIVKDNVGRGFRPGYFLFTAPFLSFFDYSFETYFHFFRNLFFLSSLVFYLSLFPLIGRLAAALLCLLTALSPFQFEWISTSTTDGLGLLFLVLALSFLFFFVQSRKWRFLTLFALFFSFNSLTRPLLAPFLAAFGFYILLHPYLLPRFRDRLKAVGIMALTFMLPTFAWAGLQKLVVGEFSISQNDASAFYAASDPQIQEWNGSMYEKVAASARQRLNIPSNKNVSTIDLNEEFWLLTVKNYREHWPYHLKRIRYHLKALLKTDFDRLSTGLDLPFKKFVYALAILIVLLSFPARASAALALALLLLIYLTPGYHYLFALAALAIALSSFRKDDLEAYRLFILLWLSGAASIWLIGGTASPIPQDLRSIAINPLGYRLSSQFHFASFAFLVLPLAFAASKIREVQFAPFRRFFFRDTPWTFARLQRILLALLACLVALYGAGLVRTAYRARLALKADSKTFPSDSNARTFLQAQDYTLDSRAKLYVGQFSNFFWYLPTQQRSLLLMTVHEIHESKKVSAFHQVLEMNGEAKVKELRFGRGYFLYKNFDSEQTVESTTLPYFSHYPQVLAYIPLDPQNHEARLEEAVLIPLRLYAGQLSRLGLLKTSGAKVTWHGRHLGGKKFARSLRASFSDSAQSLRLRIDLRQFIRPQSLSFVFEKDANFGFETPLAFKQIGPRIVISLENNPKEISLSFRPKNAADSSIEIPELVLETQDFSSK